jgi:hypothetical protein
MRQIESMRGQSERNQISWGISNRVKVWRAFVKFPTSYYNALLRTNQTMVDLGCLLVSSSVEVRILKKGEG